MNGIRVAFEGKVSFDPELRYTQAGKAVLNVGIGVPDGKGGVEWLRATLWEDLAERMYEFCPDIVDQGVGDVDALAESLAESDHLFFWWD